MGLQDYDNARQWGHEVRAAHDCGIITKEMRDVLYEVLGAVEKHMREAQQNWADELDFD